MVCLMRLMNHYYDDYHELNTRSINQLHHLTIALDRKLVMKLQ